MQNLELKQPRSILESKNAYDIKFIFLYNLISILTIHLRIKKRGFYRKINKMLKQNKYLQLMSYNKEGLYNFMATFDKFKQARANTPFLYKISPYLSSLSRILAAVYKGSSIILGEKEAKKIFKESFDLVKKKYKEIPDLEGYAPREVLGKADEEEEKEVFSTALMDSMIKYVVEDIIKKR